jgi:hypothetical protein
MKNTKLKPEVSLSDIKAAKSKPLTKTQPNMDGETFLADTPKKGSVTKPNSKTLDGEKFLSTKEKKIKSFESFVNEMYDTDGESPYDNGDMYEESDLENKIIEILKPETEIIDGKEVLKLYNDAGMSINFELSMIEDITKENDEEILCVISGKGEDENEYVATLQINPITKKLVDWFDIDLA